jgi:hypothetical protein
MNSSTAEMLKLGPVLDLASGMGRHVQELSAAGYRPIGCDLSFTLLRTGRKEYGPMPVALADMRHLPFSSGVFSGTHRSDGDEPGRFSPGREPCGPPGGTPPPGRGPPGGDGGRPLGAGPRAPGSLPGSRSFGRRLIVVGPDSCRAATSAASVAPCYGRKPPRQDAHWRKTRIVRRYRSRVHCAVPGDR